MSEKGTYALIIELPRLIKINVGSLGKITFRKGFYAYVGSALNGLKSRIERHLNSKKKIRWHIDYLLGSSKIILIIYDVSLKRKECEIAGHLVDKFENIKWFGSSDCNCKSHLLYSSKKFKLKMSVLKAFKASDLKPREIKINKRNGPMSVDRKSM